MSRIRNNFSAAIDKALENNGICKHGAVLVIGGRIRAVACNNSEHHAEETVLRSFLARQRRHREKGTKGG
jgi:hypothetical protein